MGEASTWLVGLALIALLLFAVVHDNRRWRNRTVEQFEKDAAKYSDWAVKGMALELEKIQGRDRQAAIEYQRDEREGRHRTGTRGDDADRTKSE